MIIPEVSPMLNCIQSSDGFQYVLEVRANEGQSAITKVRIGPYYFKSEYQPQQTPFGLSKGGPENAFWMTGLLAFRAVPPGWSRWRWEVAENEAESPTYLVSEGNLPPGRQGIWKFTSFYRPWGMRVGLEVYRGSQHKDYGVSGPDYERFLRNHGEH